MKKYLIFLIAPCCVLIAANCFSQGTWTKKADFGGTPRYRSVGISIGTKAYIGTGLYQKDFWEWDQATNLWKQKADCPKGADWGTGFSIGSKVYIGAGQDFSFWEWDGDTASANYNKWTRKADYPGGGASTYPSYGLPGAVGFSIGNKGYIGTGNNHGTWYNDFWEWDGDTASATYNTWTKRATFGGIGRLGAVGFSIGNKGYIGTGDDGNGTRLKDFWEYDPIYDTWTKKADFGGVGRYSATAFVIGTTAYVGTGIISASPYDIKDFWKWDQDTNQWTQIADFSGGARSRAVGFSIGNLGYIGTGSDSTNSDAKDFWEFSISCGAATPSICMVTTDSASNYNYNVVTWDKTQSQYGNVDSFIVYRKDAITSNYLRIGAVSKNSLSAFIDTSFNIGGPNGGNPQYSSWLYKLAIRDTCGNIGAKSPYHQSMFFQQNGSNFSWNTYTVEAGQANPITGYSFLRDDNNTGNWHVLVNTLGLSTTDPNYASYPNGNWRIDALGFNCTPTAKTQSTYLKAHSNTSKPAPTGIKHFALNNDQAAIYPNPTSGQFTIDIKGGISSIAIINLLGERVLTSNFPIEQSIIDISDKPKGIYFVEMISGGERVVKKVVLQ